MYPKQTHHGLNITSILTFFFFITLFIAQNVPRRPLVITKFQQKIHKEVNQYPNTSKCSTTSCWSQKQNCSYLL